MDQLSKVPKNQWTTSDLEFIEIASQPKIKTMLTKLK